jgi:diguanylate cyclase (GGDEF)-like protein/PAS domain S-box-containing protein
MTGPRSRSGAGKGNSAGLRWVGADLVPGRFFEGDDVARRIAPFVAAGALPFALVPLAGASFGDPEVLIAAALVVSIVLLALYAPWGRLPTWTQAALPLAYFAVIALLRDASTATPSPFDPLVAIPVAWFALYGTRVELATSVLALGATLALPVWLIGEPQYESSQLALAGVTMVAAIALGGRVQSLVARTRLLAGESQAILDGVQEAFIVVDEEGLVTEWNRQAERIFGWTRDEALGRPVVTLAVPEQHRDATREQIRRFVETGAARLVGTRTETTARRRDGAEIPVEMSVSARRPGGRWLFNVLVHDISERKRAEGAMLEAEERFRRAFEDIRVGMAIVSIDGIFLQVNRALADITGYPEEELIGRSFIEITHPDDLEADLEALREIVEGERYGYTAEKRYLHANGDPVWIALNTSPIHDEQGRIAHLIAQMEDITERKATEARLTHQALHDPLTGLPNRVLFAERVRRAAARGNAASFAVIYLDLDTFKPVNDTLGHAVGDQVLIEVARRLERLLRDGDTLARLGGDEFAVLCEGVDEPVARLVAERVIEALDNPFEIDGRRLRQAASIGVALHPRNGQPADSEAILRDADRAMYKAKAAGKSRYALFDGWLSGDVQRRDALEEDLRAAVARRQLRVHYQPEIDLRTGRVTGAEALVRWEHHAHGLLEPAQFISIAEASGLISEIDDFVLWQACHQAARWRAEMDPDEDFIVSVNLSEHRLADSGLSGMIAEAISHADLPPSSLCLEVAERAVMDRRGEALSALPDLESLGVRLLIDDFGIALSSFGTIARLPRLSAIKIDRSFIAGLGRSSEDAAGVAAIVGLAHGLKLVAIAEGVETAEQAIELRALDCDRAQGFHFAPPQPAESFGALLDSARYGELIPT